MGDRRYFEFSEGTSNKFWEVWIDGSQVFTRYGKIGTGGQTTIKDEGSPAGAQKLHDKLVREKTGKGYQEKGAATGAPAAVPAAKPAAPAAPAKAAPEKAAPEKAAPAKAAPAKAAPEPEPEEAAAPSAVEPGFRRFEFKEGSSSKFWEVKVEGTEQLVRYGRLGTPGQSSEKYFDSTSEAKRETKDLINEKLKKGYKEVLPPKKPYGGDPALEAEIEKDLDDHRAYLVYADSLQSKGDPLGELIALQYQAATEPSQAKDCTKRANALLKKHAEHFFGPLAARVQDENGGLKLEWKFGFIERAAFDWGSFGDEDETDVEGDLAALFERPVARFIRALELGPIPGDEEMSMQSAVDALEALKKPSTLHELFLGHTGDWDISSTATGEFEPLTRVFPQLTKLTLRGGRIELGKSLALPELLELTIETGSLTKAELKVLGAMKTPKLESLSIWFGDPNYGASGGIKDIATILAGTGLPRLKHLGLMNCPFVGDIAKALPTSKILPQLTSLDLSMGCLSDKDVDTMVKSAAAFKHLEKLNLDDNALSDDSKPKVKVLAKEVNFGKEQDPERAGEDSYRYVSVGE